jgi:hypothetical protein
MNIHAHLMSQQGAIYRTIVRVALQMHGIGFRAKRKADGTTLRSKTEVNKDTHLILHHSQLAWRQGPDWEGQLLPHLLPTQTIHSQIPLKDHIAANADCVDVVAPVDVVGLARGMAPADLHNPVPGRSIGQTQIQVFVMSFSVLTAHSLYRHMQRTALQVMA